MTRFLLALAAAVCATATLSAERIYILADEGCTDRIRYQEARGQTRNDYYAYAFRMRDGGLLSLETGVEGSTMQYNLPADYIGCGNLRLAPNIANRVGNGIDEVFILRKAFNGQYMVHPVQAAAVMRNDNDKLTYVSKLTSFQMNVRYAELDTDISYLKPSVNVILVGAEPGPCSPELFIQQKQKGGVYPLIEFKISQELGLLERRLGSNGVTSEGSVIQARAVNGVPIRAYLATHCERLKAGEPNIPFADQAGMTQYNGYGGAGQTPSPNVTIAPRQATPQPYYQNQPSVAPPTVPLQPESQAYQDQQKATAEQPRIQPQTLAPRVVNEQTHQVVKGETLYAISRKYDTTAEAIKRRNGIASNTIHPGQKLKISTGAGVVTDPPTSMAPAAAPTSPAPAPTPAPVTAATTPATNAAVYQANGKTRIVRAGETVASVALLSGYTESKFRAINQLGDQDVLYTGQLVVTDHCNCPGEDTPTTFQQTPRAVTLPGADQRQPPAAPAPQPYDLTPAAPTFDAPVYKRPADVNPPKTGYTAPAPTTYQSPSPSDGQPAANPPTQTMTSLESRRASPTNVEDIPYYKPADHGQPALRSDPFKGTQLLEAPKAVKLADAKADPRPSARRFHKVQDGETIRSIAGRYNMAPERLRALNNLSVGAVPAPFQKLYIE